MSTTLRPRITGTEMEWGIMVQATPGGADHPIETATLGSAEKHRSPDLLRVNHGSSSNFYSNGSRLYIDIGQHLEYATPEDDSFMGTIANEIAGERIVQHMMKRLSENRIHESDRSKVHAFSVNKRVRGDDGVTWGYHESYAASAQTVKIEKETLALLGIHLATRNVFVGAGALDKYGNYLIAQKGGDLTTDFSASTTNGKPVVNLRNEPHADNGRWLRVHVTSGDPNIMPWATFMKLGTTSLVLRLIEHGQTLKHLRVSSLARVAVQVAKDSSLRQTIGLEDDKKWYPYQVQAELAKAARELSEIVELPAEELWALGEWEKACNDAVLDPYLLRDRTDWGARLSVLERYRDKHGLPWDSEAMRRKDRQYDNMGPRGIGRALRSKLRPDLMPRESLIVERGTTAPSTTRAHLRGRFIAHFANNGQALADWALIKYKDRSVQLRNPYANKDERVDKLMGTGVAALEKVA